MSARTWVRLVIASALLVVLACVRPGWTVEAKGKKYALLVGVAAYDSSHFASLQYTDNDAEELARVLDRPGNGFASIRVLTTSRGKKNKADEPTAVNIRKALKELLAGKKKHDLVLIALSGHGVQVDVKDPKDEKPPKTYPYFCPSNASLSDIRYSNGESPHLIHLDQLFDAVGKCDAGARLVLIDACRNDVEARGRNLDVGKVTIPRGVGTLFSCSSGQRAFETEKFKHGVFFHFVLEGLKGEAKNKRGVVTWDSLAAYVKDEVSQEVGKIIGGGAKQDPHLIANLTQSPVLVRVARTDVPERKEKTRPAEKKVAKGGEVADEEKEVRARARVVVTAANAIAYEDDSSDAPNLDFDSGVPRGTKGKVVKMSADNNRCLVELDTGKEAWLLTRHVRVLVKK